MNLLILIIYKIFMMKIITKKIQVVIILKRKSTLIVNIFN